MVITIKKIGSDELSPGPCPVCGNPIPMSSNACRQRRYCSFACSNKTWDHTKGPRPGKWEERVCVICGEHFTVRHYKATKTCSRKCGRSLNGGGSAPDPTKRVTQPCAECGKPVTSLLIKNSRYCSQTCRAIFVGRSTNTHYNATCDECGETFSTIPSQAARFCSQSCYGEWHSKHRSGSASPLWRGGKHFNYGPSWQRARRAVLSRDKQCRDCGATKSAGGRSLEVHHLTQFRVFGLDRHEEANDLANLVVLCQQCHLTVEWDTHWRKPAAAA